MDIPISPKRPEPNNQTAGGTGTCCTPIVNPCQLSFVGTVKLIDVNVPRNFRVPFPSIPERIFPDNSTTELPPLVELPPPNNHIER